MTTLPEPLTPPECDLSHYGNLPLDIARLRASAFDAMDDDAAWRAGLNLWMTAWHKSPAGSLPDNEAELAKAAGLGRDVKAWRKVRDKALNGFVECADGRLYHETLCEIALESWIETLKQRKRSGAGNEKRWAKAFDGAELDAAISHAFTMLARINPRNPKLPKRSLKDAPGLPKRSLKDAPRKPTENEVGSPRGGDREEDSLSNFDSQNLGFSEGQCPVSAREVSRSEGAGFPHVVHTPCAKPPETEAGVVSGAAAPPGDGNVVGFPPRSGRAS